MLEATKRLLDFDLDAAIADLTASAERAAAEGPQLFSFAVSPEDAPLVERAIEQAMETLSGKNRRGEALVLLSAAFLEAEADA